ncbi:MAG: glycerophosphodiester phosphodiesterase family protein [Adhaeribacter sp.]
MHLMKSLALMILLTWPAAACKTTEVARLEVQGHRGLPGILPANSIAGFLKARDIGVQTLSLEVFISRDSQVVVSEEPFFSGERCLREGGIPISKNSERNFNLYRMEYSEIRKFDCGSLGDKDFPLQQKMLTYKPLLTQAIDSVEQHATRKNLAPPHYQVEIRSALGGDELYHPAPAAYAEHVLKALRRKGVLERATILSADVRPLKYIHSKYPKVRLALRVDNDRTPEQNLKDLGFAPQVYSPRHQLVDAPLMLLAKQKKMQVIPWTVNDAADIEKMMALGVDGMISDYPNRVLNRSQPGKSRKKA